MLNTSIQFVAGLPTGIVVAVTTYILVITGSGGVFESLTRKRNTAEEALKLVHEQYRDGEICEEEMEEQIEDILCWAD